MILPWPRDPRFITVRRGGTLSDDDHRRLAWWAALCAERVLAFFEETCPTDHRPRMAIEAARSWVRGELPMVRARAAAFAAGQAAVVPHVAAHELGAAAYAIKALWAAHPTEAAARGHQEVLWQRSQLPAEIRDLVLDDQRLRNALCWNAFEVGPLPEGGT